MRDTTEKRHLGLASCTESGDIPASRRVGSGMVGIDGLEIGDQMTAEQMQSLSAPVCTSWRSSGWTPSTGPELTEANYLAVSRLGSPFRSEVGREFFSAEYGREPVDARELAGSIAKLSRPQSTVITGFDLTSSPVNCAASLRLCVGGKPRSLSARSRLACSSKPIDSAPRKARRDWSQ